MEAEGPLLDALTHRLSECPGEFLAEPSAAGRADQRGAIDVAAIVCDHFRALGLAAPSPEALQLLRPATDAAAANRLRLVAVSIWLLHDDALRGRAELGPKIWTLVSCGLDRLAAVARAETFVTDPDRREELVRFCLQELGLRPAGETLLQAKDRLTALDSVERTRILNETREAEARAREVREMMARRAAEEAAAKVSRE